MSIAICFGTSGARSTLEGANHVPVALILNPAVGVFALVFLLATWCGIATAATQSSNDPQALVHNTIEELRAAVIQEKAAIESDPNRAVIIVDRIVSPHVDTTRSGRLILGKHWREATPEQRQQFIDNYKRMLLRTYAIRVSDYTDVGINYLQTITGGNDQEAVVRTRVSPPGKDPIDVDYRMARTDAGWMVYDVVANGVSIVVSFRSAVDAEIKQYGIGGLIARLAAKVDSRIAN